MIRARRSPNSISFYLRCIPVIDGSAVTPDNEFAFSGSLEGTHMTNNRSTPKCCLAVCLALTFVLTINQADAQVVPYTSDANTVLLDHFNGATSATISAYYYDGSPTGTAFPSATPSYSFGSGPNGLNQELTLYPPTGTPVGSATYFSYPGGQLLSQANGTIEFWVYIPSFSKGVSLVDQGQYYNAAYGWTFNMGVDSTGKLNAEAWAAFSMNSGTTLVPPNTWTHVAATWGSNGAKLYINGVQVGSSANTGMPASGYSGSVLIRLGTYAVSGVGIDELRISNIQRTSFNATGLLPATPANLVATAGNGQATLTWNKITANRFLRYRIYRGTTSGGEVLSDSSSNSILDTSKVVTGLSNGTKYYFQVTAMDSSRLESPRTNEVSATPQIPYATFTQPLNNLGITDTVGMMGFAWGDYDNDGNLDLFLSGNEQSSILYHGGGAAFSKTSFTDDPAQVTYGAVWGDFDGDGKLDALFTEGTGLKLNKGNGAGVFSDISSSSGLTGLTGGSLWMASAADFDRDGDLDIVLAGGGSTYAPLQILRNSAGVYTNVASTLLGSVYSYESWNPAWVDVNNDGLLDLWVPTVRTPSWPCALYINQGSTFALSSPGTTGLTAASAIASAWGDYDNDGFMDLFLIPFSADSAGVAKLYHNNGNGTFTNVASSMGLDFPFADSRGVCWGDYDNDGKLDLLITRRDNQQQLWRNTGTTFVEVGGPAGIAMSGRDSRSGMFVDFNNDGFLDVFLAGLNKPKALFQNNGGNGNHWIGIRTAGTGNNKSAIGARVRIAIGSTRQIRDIQAGGTGGMTNGNIWASFGLGAATTVDSVTVQWPNGQIEVFKNPPIDRYSTIVQGSSTLPPVIASFTPTSGPVGTSVTITGTNFNANPSNNVVYFGAVKATVTAATSTSLTVTTPAGATYAPISLTDTTTHLTVYSSARFTPTFLSSRVVDVNAFAAKVDFATGVGPYSTVIADFDHDGKPDIAVSNAGNNSVSVFRNISTIGSITAGSFAAKVDFTTGTSPHGIAVGDVDGDGKLDFVVPNWDSNTISVFRNTSTAGTISAASFAAKVDFAASSNPSTVAIADVDGDGRPDLIVPNYSSNTVSVFRNIGTGGNVTTGTFAAKVDFTTGSGPIGVAIADLDGDGKPDIVTTNKITTTVSVFRNTSTNGSITSSSFANKVDFTVGSNPYGIVAADFDLDAKLDLAVTNSGANTVSVLRNISTGGTITSASFSAKVDFTTGSAPADMADADLDGDGSLDLAIANTNSSTVSVFRNTAASGSITSNSFASKVDFTTTVWPYAVAVNDLDGDGKPDIVVTNNGSTSISIYRNTISVPSVISFSVDMSKQVALGQLQAGDTVMVRTFTGVSHNKILAVVPGTSIYRDTVNFGSATGAMEYKFWKSRGVNDGQRYEAAIGPVAPYGNRVDTAVAGLKTLPTVFFNNDSAIAVASVNPQSGPIGSSVTLTGYRFNPVATNNIVRFGPVKAPVTSASATSLTVTVPSGASYGPVSVMDTTCHLTDFSTLPYRVIFSSSRIISSSSFAAKVDFTAGTNPFGLVIADVDGDGKSDVIQTNYNSASVSVYRNTSTSGAINISSFAGKVDFTTGSIPYGVAAGDLDGDGKIDLVVANNASSTISVYRNTSTLGNITTGSFASKVDFTAGTNPWGVVITDVDGDGKLDIAVSNFGSNTVSVFRNTSTTGSITSGSFAAKADFATGSYPVGLAAGDIDGDGKSDLVVANSGANTVTVFMNTSSYGSINSGSFAAKVDFTTGSYPIGVVVGDLDGDGKPEVVVANNTNNSISVLRNTSTVGTVTTTSLAAKVDFTVGTSPYFLAMGDADGDGKVDLAVTNSGGSTISILKNTTTAGSITTGSLASAVSYTTASSPRGVGFADFDGDGKPDLAVANAGSVSISVLRNTVTLAPPPIITSFSPSSGPVGTTMTIAGTNFNTTAGANKVYFGSVKATVTSASLTNLSLTVPSGAMYSRISVTDTVTGLTGISMLPFTPTFTSNAVIDASSFAPKSDITLPANPWALQAVDVDGDGRTDLVAANDGANSISIYRNTSSSGSITFASRIDSSIGQQPKHVVCGDLDGDGRPDIITTNQSANSLSIFRNTSSAGSISLAPKVALTDTGGPFYAALGDLDGDGKLDIIVANIGTNKISVLRNTSTVGSLSFAGPTYFTSNNGASGVAVGDIDGDGLPDVVVANSGGNTITILRNTSTTGNISLVATNDIGVTASASPWIVTLADLDRDSKLDVILINSSASTVSVFRNLSSPGSVVFNAREDQTTNTNPWALTVSDINGDGKPDVLVSYQNSPNVSVFKNTSTSGSISFAAKVDFGTTGNSWGVIAADLDGDGKPDLAATNNNSSSVSILRNTSSAFNWVSFGVNMSKQRASGSLQTGDTVRVLIFSPTTLNRSLPSTGKILGIAPTTGTDIYRDTVNVGTYTGAISFKFWKSRGSSDSVRYEQPYGATGNRFATVGLGPTVMPSVYFGADSVGAPVALGASTIRSTSFTANWNSVFSASGYLLDVSTSNSFASYVSGYQAKSLGSATSTSVSGLAAGTSYYYRLRTVAANGTSINSNPIWVVTTPPPSVSSFSPISGAIGSTVTIAGSNFSSTAVNNIVYFGGVRAIPTAATASSITSTVPVGATYQPITVTVDGLTAYSKTPYLVKFSGGGTMVANSFAQNVDFGTGTSPISAALSDIDGDGKLDLVFTNGSSNVSVCRNTSSTGTMSSASFGSRVDFSTGGGRFVVAVGDLDGDGKPDLVVANNSSNVVSVFRNTSTAGSITTASFATHVDFAAGSSPTCVAIGDIDGDGKPDIAVTNTGSNTISVFRNTGASGSMTTSSFAAKVDLATGSSPEIVAIGDLDGDGKPDLGVTNNASSTVSVFRNTSIAGSISASSFASRIDLTAGANPFGLAVGDLDGDGKLDLVVSSQINNAVSVFRNTSTSGSITASSFAPKVDFATGTNPFSVAIGDLDGDGKPDLAVANSGTNTVSVLRNTSTSGSVTASSFAGEVEFTSGGNPYSVAIGDIDGDSKPELVTANNNVNTLSVMLNTVGSVVPTITVATPAANWATTYTHNIAWTSQDLSGNVNIKLSVDNAATFPVTIASNIPNSGKYSWTVPFNQTLSGTCVLRVESATSTSIYGLSNVFAIVNGSNVTYGQPATVAATYSSNPTSNNEYRLISFPGNVDNTDVGQLNLSGTPDQDWKMFREPGNSSTGFVPMGTNNTLKTGEGYWYIQKGSLSKGVSFNTPALDGDATVSIALTGGVYSIIGNPFNIPIPWVSVLSLNGIASNTPLFSWKGSWSSSNTTLEPGVGYYINSTGMTTLKIPYAAFGFPSQAPGEKLNIKWRLQLAFDSELNKDDDNYIGIAVGTSVGKDRFEFNKPPLIFDESFVYMKRPEWNSQNDMFFSDYRPEIADGQTWDFEITNPSKSLSKISVAGVDQVPSTYNVYLVNEETGVTTNLRRQNSMQYGYGRTTGHFKVVVGPESYVSRQLEKYMPKEFSLEQNYPNPFNPSTTVTFKMPKGGSVRLEVFSLLGQRIKVLAEGSFEAGVHQVVWMGDNDWGARVASGVYFCRFISEKNNVQTRKMLLTK
jgi:hypothetical protein